MEAGTAVIRQKRKSTSKSSKTDMVWPLAKAKRVRNTSQDEVGQVVKEQRVQAASAEGAARPLGT